MPTPVLNNGVFVRDTNYKVSSNLDSFHLRNMLGASKPTDLGVVDLWAMAQKVAMPLYQMANFQGKNRIPVKDTRGEYTWRTAVTNDMPFIVEDVAPSGNIGADGQPFPIKLNKRAYGNGDIITYDKYSGLELHITFDDILPVGDGYIFMVTLVNKDSYKTMDRKYLAPGTKFFRVSSAKSGEYGQRWSQIGEQQAGFREYYNFVGQAHAHVEYSVSNRAELMARGGITAEGALAVTELWRCFDENLKGDPSMLNLDSMATKLGKNGMAKLLEQGKLTRTFITQMEGVHLTKIANDIEHYLMWGKGGRIRNQEGPDDIRLSVGLWQQLDNSYKKIYNYKQFSLDLFKSELFNYFNGKVDFTGPDPKRTIIVQTGLAGMQLVSESIQHEARGANMVIDASSTGAISGSAMNLEYGFAFTKFKIPYLANVQFVLNPAFDPVEANDIENPIIDGYRLSSYSFIIFDVTDQGNDNIYLLELDWDKDLTWFYQNGTMDYMGRTSGFQSSGDFSGYKVKMQQAHKAVWVKDPTRVLKIVMKNPVTGSSF